MLICLCLLCMAASVPVEQRTQVTVFSAQAYDITFFNSELERLYVGTPHGRIHPIIPPSSKVVRCPLSDSMIVLCGVWCVLWGCSKAPLVFKFVEASLTMATVPLAQGSKVQPTDSLLEI